MVISKRKPKKKLEAKPAQCQSVHHKHCTAIETGVCAVTFRPWQGSVDFSVLKQVVCMHTYHCALEDEHGIWLPPQKHA